MFQIGGKVVRATTRGEVDAALQSPRTRRIEVVGDDDLLSYAAQRASVSEDARVAAVETGYSASPPDDFGVVQGLNGRRDARIVVGDVRSGAGVRIEDVRIGAPPLPEAPAQDARVAFNRAWHGQVATKGQFSPIEAGARLTLPDGEPNSVRGDGSKRRYVPLWAVGCIAACALLTPLVLYWLWAALSGPSYPPGVPRVNHLSDTPAWVELVSALGYPLVALAAVLGVVIIAWRAIDAGRNLHIEWKIGEKVAGKLVIEKTQRQSRKASKAA